MDYEALVYGTLLWIELVATALLFLACVTGIAARSRRRSIQIGLPVTFALGLAVPPLMLVSANHAVLWAESTMAAALYLVCVASITARSKREPFQFQPHRLLFALILIVPPLVLVVSEIWFRVAYLSNVGRSFLITWPVAIAWGAGAILFLGFRKRPDTQFVAAFNWSPLRLLLGAGITYFLIVVTSIGVSPGNEDTYDLVFKVEWTIFAALLLTWVVGTFMNKVHGQSQSYVPGVVVFVLGGNLIGLQLAVTRAAPHLFPHSPPNSIASHGYSMFGYGLLCVESIAAAVIVVASVTAFAARSTRRFGQSYVPLLFTFSAAAFASVVSQWAIWLKVHGHVEHPWVPYTVAWTVAFSVAAGAVVILGLRELAADPKPAAANWSRLRLTLGSGAALILVGVTLNNMDAAITMQTVAAQADANARLARMMLPAVAERDNAALVYQQAAEALPFPYPYEQIQEILGEETLVGWRVAYTKPFDARDPRLTKYLKDRAAALSFFRKASWKTECRFDHDYSRGLESLLPELNTVREGSSLLVLDALAKAARGDLPNAEANLAAILRMPRHLTEPNRVTVWVAIWIERAGATLLEKLLATQSKGKSVFRSSELECLLGTSAEDSRYSWKLRRACKGEESLFIASFSNLPLFFYENKENPPNKAYASLPSRLGLASPWFLNTLAYRVALLSDDLGSYRKQMEELQSILCLPYPRASESISNYWNQDPMRETGFPSRAMPPGLIASLALPQDVLVQLRKATEADALHRLMRVAYSIIRYRAKYNKDPIKLDDLVPEFLTHVPLDPFDNKPLRMKKGETGVILYSVGPDLKDDGGVDGKEDQGDIVFRMP